MLRALSLEEVAFVSGGMMEDSDSFDSDGGGGGDDGSYGGDSGSDGYAAAGNSSGPSPAPAPSPAPSTSPAGTALDNAAAGGLCLAGVGTTLASDGLVAFFAGAGTVAACVQAGRAIAASIKP